VSIHPFPFGSEESCVVTYNLTKVGVNVRLDPNAASREILRVFKACRADAASASARLGVSRRTFDRWVRLLELESQMASLRKDRIIEERAPRSIK
jgi:hypothetical protein